MVYLYEAPGKSSPPCTQRALIILKPDGIKHFSRAIGLLAESLHHQRVNFRILHPFLTNVTPDLAARLWTEPGEKFDNHRKYMSAGYTDPRIVSAPVITMIIEAETKAGQDLISILRSPDVIGPTNVEAALKTADPETAKKVLASLRYQLTLGAGSRIWPFPKKPGDPMYNRLHCSASPEEAQREIDVAYPEEAGNLVRIPLLELAGRSDVPEILTSRFGTLGYRDFGERERLRFAFEINETLPLLLELEGHFLENLNKSQTEFFDLGRFKGKRIPSAYIIGICGDVGSGKTSLVNALTEWGYKEMVLHTNRQIRKGETEGRDYYFMGEEQMVDSVAQGEFVGVDRVGDALYGLSTFWVHPANLSSFKGVIAAGPNTLAGLRAALPPEVKLGTNFLHCSPETLEKRLIARKRESGEALQRRIERVRKTKERYAPRLDEFDLILDNSQDGQFLTILDQALAFRKGLEAGEIEQRRDLPLSYKMTPPKRLVQFLFDHIFLSLAATVRDQIKPLAVDDLKKEVQKLLEESLTLFLSEMFKEYHKRPYLTEEEQKMISTNLVPHILNAYLVSRQIFQPWETVRRAPKRLGRLGEYGAPERIAGNLATIREAARSIPEKERDLIIFLHDIGKIIRFFGHPKLSAQLIDAYNLLEFVDYLSPQQKKMVLLLIKYHQNIGDYAYASMSWYSAVIEMFKDEDARSLFSKNDGSADLEAVKEFIVRHKFMTTCDVSGSLSEKGGLRNINFELYTRILDRIYLTFKEYSSSYENALRGLEEAGKESGKEQLTGMVFGFDTLADQREGGSDFYWNLIIRSKDRALAGKLITQKEWETLLKDLAYIDSKYCPHLWWVYLGAEPKKEVDGSLPNKPGEEPPTSLWNHYAIMGRIMHEIVPDFGPARRVTFEFYDADNKELAGKTKEYDSAWEMHQLFSTARDYKIEGNEVIFLDRNGQVLDAIKGEVVPGETNYTFRFRHYNLSYRNANNHGH